MVYNIKCEKELIIILVFLWDALYLLVKLRAFKLYSIGIINSCLASKELAFSVVSYQACDFLFLEKIKRGKNMGKVYIAMYHYTRDLVHSRYPGIKGLDVNLFKRQLDFFKSNFVPISMEQLLCGINGNIDMPDNSVLLTFDDGYVDNYTFAMPLLEEFDIQGSFFIPGKTLATHKLLDVNKIHYILASADIEKLLVDVKERMDFYRGKEFDYESNEELYNKYAIANRFDNEKIVFIKRMLQTVLPEKLRNVISSEVFEKYVGVSEEKLAYELYMTYDQVATLKKHGHFIGLHGYDHYWLANLPVEQMFKDIDQALDTLDPFIDRNKWVMNYPYGNYNDEVINYIKSKGCVLGLTTEVRVVDISKDDIYRFPRLDCNDFPPKSENYKKL